MGFHSFIEMYGEAAKTSLGFFWKAGWAFVLGYFVSAMIQAFVPKGRLTPYMGSGGLKSISLATLIGAASSSCSFAALATARSLILKGASFIAGVAFMFASTNLVIELGILILIFLGWQYLLAEIIGGIILIAVSSLIVKATFPKKWAEAARERLEEAGDDEESGFDWKKRIRSVEGWRLVGHRFVMDWQMVWEEILIGFTVAGFVAVLVPAWFWKRIFLMGAASGSPGLPTVLENALVAPFVAAATFIGSMGNIPLATVLSANNVLFAGIMGFIYSDLMVPPLVMINAKYYGKRVALYIAGVMYVSIVVTAVALHYGFGEFGMTPHTGRDIAEVSQFGVDYTLFMNAGFAVVAGVLYYLHRAHKRTMKDMGGMSQGGLTLKRAVAITAALVLATGIAIYLLTGGPA